MSIDGLAHIKDLAAYVPGLSIAEILQKYGLSSAIKLASNENPLGASPLVCEAIKRSSASAFRYPQGGNPRLVQELAKHHELDAKRIVAGNGSDELIDLLIRIMAEPRVHNIVCFNPCFSIYPIQAKINNNPLKRLPVNHDFSFDFQGLLELVDDQTRLVFITTPDNPSGFCPERKQVQEFAEALKVKNPQALLVIDEAYMDFAPDEKASSLLASKILPDNTAFIRTFSKSYGLAGLRLGYVVLPEKIADLLWRTRLPFSVNLLAEEAGLAALKDKDFHSATLEAVTSGREFLSSELKKLGCAVWPSAANFLMFKLPAGRFSAAQCHEKLLQKGIIIRALKSYNLPDHLRVSIGNHQENQAFLTALGQILQEAKP